MKKPKTMTQIFDDLTSPDIRVYHNELQELTGIVGITPRGKEYIAGEVYFKYMGIDGLQFPDLFVEYIERP